MPLWSQKMAPARDRTWKRRVKRAWFRSMRIAHPRTQRCGRRGFCNAFFRRNCFISGASWTGGEGEQ